MVAVFEHPDYFTDRYELAAFPDDLEEFALEECRDTLDAYAGSDAAAVLSETAVPSVEDWELGDRRIICWAESPSGQLLTEPLRTAGS